ncbi:MAG: monovalent cation:proton antiporter-2 (CPA2) family protein [Kofleriaceae bacterium]
MTDSVLVQAVIYLAAAVIGVPLAKRAGLGAVLGYLIAGVVIGPFVLGLVGGEGHHVMHFAEFGVVMMLFLVGLELRPALLWQMRRRIFGLGGLQVVASAAVLAGVALALGVAAKPALATGLILAMSSTAIVLSTLAEKKLLASSGGQGSFSVLLFQDIAVIPILALFPVLAVAAPAASADAGRPGWLQGLLVLGAVIAVVGVGRYLVRPVFRVLSRTGLRETFTAFALLLVVGIALLMTLVDLSPALGTFLAGVMLADSEYRHELEGDIEPFKGLLLGLFFISVGAQIDFGLIADDPVTIAGLTLGTMAVKLGVLYALARLFGFDRPARWLIALGLCQVGEFAFVLLSVATSGGIFDAGFAAPLVAVVALSMGLTPVAFIVLERVVLPWATKDGAPARPADEIAHADVPVVIAGYGRFGQVVGRILRANRVPMTILDLDPEIVEFVVRLDIKVHYGDASRVELLHAAGCARAKVLVVAVDDHAQALAIVHAAREPFPHLQVLARAKDRPTYYELLHAGAHFAMRETFVSAYETGIAALRSLGARAYTAERRAARWRRHEERELAELAALRASGDEEAYWDRTRRALDEAERLMRDEDPVVFAHRDGAWDNESLRVDADARGAPTAADEAPPPLA